MSDQLVEVRPEPDATTASDSEGRARVSRWDRPPPPKDWRYFVGMLGKILIATGLLMFGFVAYQLWGTGIETARAQNKLENTFEAQLEAVEEDAETVVDAGEPGDGTGEADDESDDESDEPSVAPGVGGTPSSIVPGAVDLSDDAVDHDVPVVPGEAFAKLDIDKIGIDDLYVIPGVALSDLKKGPGHYPTTPLPGQLGNAAIAGHRTTYGSPFIDLDQLAPGDEIVVTMVTGDRFVYRVTGSQVVTPADSWVITTRDPNVAELTLTTCDPKYTARNRLVVHSVLVPEESSQVGLAEFYDLDESDAASESADSAEPAADDPNPTVSVAADEGADPGEEAGSEATEPEVTIEAAAEDVATAEPDASSEPAAIDPDEIDAFSHGWFEDRGAFAQIALWAGVLVAISVLAYQLAKRTRHTSVGLLVGVVPFVVALYFFYQNVNRLLPPGL